LNGNNLKINLIMKKAFFLICFLLGLLFSGNLNAQVHIERSKNITKIGGKEYYMHHVKQGETLWSLSKVYNVSIEEIELLNPDVKKNGLKAGHVLGIPVRPLPEPEVEEPVVEEPKPEPEPESIPIVVEPEPEPVVVEPEPEPQPVVEEPKPEPVVVEPEPVVVEPEPEPVVVEPEPEPVVVEPEPTPVVVEPEPEPQPVVEEPKPEPVVVEPEPVIAKPEPAVVKVGGRYVVQANEDLYDIAKKFGIDVADFKALNPSLANTIYEGMAISVPDIVNENDYIVHKVEFNERTSSLVKRWKVDEAEFRAMNVSVGSHVFTNQTVLIPIDRIKPESVTVDEPVVEEVETPQIEEPVIVEEPTIVFNEPLETPECYADPANASRRYEVALLIPLYLNDVNSLEISKDNMPNLQKARSLSFLPFYEGFMMAVEKMTDEQGLKLDLTVIDVTDNVSTAQRALDKIENQHFDLIIGPFFSKSFAIIEEYAKAHNILVVNPLSTRNEVVEGNANVIKLKPSKSGQILDIAYLVRNRYPDANVFILSREKVADSLFLSQLEHELNIAVNDEVTVSGNEFMEYARSESQRLEMGSRLVSTITVEGQVYSTNDLKDGTLDHVVLANPVHRYAYNSENLHSLISQLSGVRDNVIIAYGDDNVFATQVLNTLKKEADRVPITLVCAPDWTKFEKLLVENLLQMNAIYLTDNFVDYSSAEANSFVLNFRRQYVVEPQNYAFEGYDVATCFLTALMRYGSEMTECLPYFKMPLLHTQYHFMRKGMGNGLENQNWSMYQYDKENIKLVPVNPFKKAEK
jgi:LysM repeat protein